MALYNRFVCLLFFDIQLKFVIFVRKFNKMKSKW